MNIKKSLISLLLCLPLLSCQTARYTDTASCRFLAEEVRGVLPQEKFAELGEDALALVLEDRGLGKEARELAEYLCRRYDGVELQAVADAPIHE